MQDIVSMQNKQMGGWQSKLQDKDAYFREERKLRVFYQKLVMKFLRDVEAFKDDPA